MGLPADKILRLDPKDDYTHPVEEVINYNESMYFNVFDHNQRLGGWFRIGNRPNEKYAEVTCCIYLPDGRVAFMFKRPEISHNDDMNAGGLSIEIVEPMKKQRIVYSGSLCLLDNPYEMSDPRKAFKNNPHVKAEICIDFEGCSPVDGGEVVNKDGSPIEQSLNSMARAHYEQNQKGSGTIQVGDDSYVISGIGLRDHSWGPRYWQAVYWYRWLTMSFSEDFAITAGIVSNTPDKRRVACMIQKGDRYISVKECTIETQYNDDYYQESMKIWIKDEEGEEYNVDAKVLSLIPLRNRRETPEGEKLLTRITEAMTEYRCNGMVGYGMSEYLDQIVDDLPVGREC